jgi:hypothetical protein
MTKLPHYFRSLSSANGLSLVRRSCEEKTGFRTQKLAHRAMSTHKVYQRHTGKLGVYQCSFCGGWHVGHER